MADTINTGAAANDNTGDPLRTALQKVNSKLAAMQAGYSEDAQDIVTTVEAARDESLAQASTATTKAAEASASAVTASAARDAAYTNANVYPSTADGIAAVAEGVQFQVAAADGLSIQRYRRDPGPVATAVGVPYPSASIVLKPPGAGRVSGWEDVFFRSAQIGESGPRGPLWLGAGGVAASLASLSLQPGTVFDGGALRKTGEGVLCGPVVYIADLGLVPGDTITFRALVTAGTPGAVALFPARPYADLTMAGTGSQINLLTETGDFSAALGSTPTLFSFTTVIPAGTSFYLFYPYATAGDASLDIQALWATAGGAELSPKWPSIDIFPTKKFNTMATNLTDLSADMNEISVSVTAIEAASAVTVLAPADPSSGPRALTFCGWGERYTPAGVSFNCLEIQRLMRTAPTEPEKWKTLHIVVRTGADSHLSTAPIVAVGSADVSPDINEIQSLKILLRDQATGAVKTLTNTDFSGGEYFVGVYAFNAAGAPAACGEPLGTMSNALGSPQSYYTTSTEPASASWSVYSGNLRMGFAHLLLGSPVESTVRMARAAFATSVADAAANVGPEVVLPTDFYGVEGREANLYFDNLLLESADDYNFRCFSYAAGVQQLNECVRWVPTGAVAAAGMTVDVVDKRTGSTLSTHSIMLRAAAATAGAGTTKKVMLIGDSLIANAVISETLAALGAADAMGITLYGSRGTGLAKHEGRPGWAIADYTGPGRTAEIPAMPNPFWIGGAVSFGQYLTDTSTPVLDWVVVGLGINDVFSQTTDSGARAKAATEFAKLDVLIDSIKASGASTKIGLMVPSPPSRDQDAFGLSEALGTTLARFKRSILILARALLARYAGQEANRIYIIPSNLSLDTENNMLRAASAPVNSRSLVSRARQSNGVHPAVEGYQQIADAIWAWLKFHG